MNKLALSSDTLLSYMMKASKTTTAKETLKELNQMPLHVKDKLVGFLYPDIEKARKLRKLKKVV